MKTGLLLIACLGAALLLLSSCGDDNTGGPNLLPDTQIISGPAEGSTALFRVVIAWEGTDPDGDVTAYEYAWHSGPVPDADPDSFLTWTTTTAERDTFRVLADSCCSPQGFYHGHTFFVRAVDNQGGKDPEPAHRSFTATTFPPTSRIDETYLRQPGQFLVEIPSCIRISWVGNDADGQAVKFRYARKRYLDIPAMQPPDWDDPSDTRISDWITGTETTLEGLSPTTMDNPWSFYLQAMDNAGAVETSFVDARNHVLLHVNEDMENLANVQVCCYRGPDPDFGVLLDCRSTYSDTTDWETPIYVNSGDTLSFKVTASPGEYASKITHVQYTFNVPNPPASWLSAKEDNLVYPQGNDVFEAPPLQVTLYVWVKDDYCSWGSRRRVPIVIDGT